MTIVHASGDGPGGSICARDDCEIMLAGAGVGPVDANFSSECDPGLISDVKAQSIEARSFAVDRN